MITEKTETVPDLVAMAHELERSIVGVVNFSQEEQDALNKLKSAIFVNLTKNLGDIGITRSGR